VTTLDGQIAMEVKLTRSFGRRAGALRPTRRRAAAPSAGLRWSRCRDRSGQGIDCGRWSWIPTDSGGAVPKSRLPKYSASTLTRAARYVQGPCLLELDPHPWSRNPHHVLGGRHPPRLYLHPRGVRPITGCGRRRGLPRLRRKEHDGRASTARSRSIAGGGLPAAGDWAHRVSRREEGQPRIKPPFPAVVGCSAVRPW
jgi:hypothetical protein